jgi:hypothetical protein
MFYGNTAALQRNTTLSHHIVALTRQAKRLIGKKSTH